MKNYQDIVINNVGIGIPSVSVSIYLTGTTTLAQLYSDDGVTTTTNPIVTDAYGRFSFYIADGVYDFKFTGSTITTYQVNGLEVADQTQSFSTDTSAKFKSVFNWYYADSYGVNGAAVDSALTAAGVGGSVIKTPLFTSTADPTFTSAPSRALVFDISGQKGQVGLSSGRSSLAFFMRQTDSPDAYPNNYSIFKPTYWVASGGDNTLNHRFTYSGIDINTFGQTGGELFGVSSEQHTSMPGDSFAGIYETFFTGGSRASGNEGKKGIKAKAQQTSGGVYENALTIGSYVNNGDGTSTVTVTGCQSVDCWMIGDQLYLVEKTAGKTAAVTITSISSGAPPVVTLNAGTPLSANMLTACNANGLAFRSDVDTYSGNNVETWLMARSCSDTTHITLETLVRGADVVYPGNYSAATTGLVAFASQVANNGLITVNSIKLTNGYTGWQAGDTAQVPVDPLVDIYGAHIVHNRYTPARVGDSIGFNVTISKYVTDAFLTDSGQHQAAFRTSCTFAPANQQAAAAEGGYGSLVATNHVPLTVLDLDYGGNHYEPTGSISVLSIGDTGATLRPIRWSSTLAGGPMLQLVPSNSAVLNILGSGILQLESLAVKAKEMAAPSGTATYDFLWADSTDHRWKFNNNNGGADTVVGAATTDTFTHKTIDSAGAGNSICFNGNCLTGTTGGSTSIVLSSAPTITAGGSWQGSPVIVAPSLQGQTIFGGGGAASLSIAENTAPSGSANNDVLWADSTAHRLKVNNNNGGSKTVATLEEVPLTYNHSGTLQTNTHVVQDTCTLGTDCAVTLVGAAIFTSSTSYTCVAQDDSAGASPNITQTSGSQFTITGTGTDVIRYICIGN